MAYTKFNEDLVNVIRSLSDTPTLSASELKLAFDTAAMNLAEYLNDTLVDELDVNESLVEESIEDMQEDIELQSDALDAHAENTTLHILSSERELWNNKQKKISYGSSDPTGGVDGDIYIQI